MSRTLGEAIAKDIGAAEWVLDEDRFASLQPDPNYAFDLQVKYAIREVEQWMRAALLSPEVLAAAEKAVHRNRGLDGSGEKAVRAALEVVGITS